MFALVRFANYLSLASLVAIALLFGVAYASALDLGTATINGKTYKVIPETLEDCMSRTHSEAFCKRNYDDGIDYAKRERQGLKPNPNTGTLLPDCAKMKQPRKAYNDGLCQY